MEAMDGVLPTLFERMGSPVEEAKDSASMASVQPLILSAKPFGDWEVRGLIMFAFTSLTLREL